MKKVIHFTSIAVTAIASIAAMNPAQAEAASTIESLVKKAEANKVILTRAISVDYDADAMKQPWKEYNKAKADYTAAKNAVSKLSTKNRALYQARLDNVKLWIDRTAGYIDAISSGDKLTHLQASLQMNLAAGKWPEAVTAYHTLSYEIKKQAKILYRVYGQSTRQEFLNLYKVPAETAKNAAVYPVTIILEMDKLAVLINEDNYGKVMDTADLISTWLYEVEDDALFELLSERLDEMLFDYYPEISDIIAGELQLPTGAPNLSGYLPFYFLDEEGYNLMIDPYEYGYIVKDDIGYFNEDGTLKDAYAETGLTELGKVKVRLIDEETNEEIMMIEPSIVDGAQPIALIDGKIVDNAGRQVTQLIKGQTYSFVPTAYFTLSGKVVEENVKLSSFETVHFLSSDNSKFTVNSEGKITPIASGKAELTINWKNEGFTLPIDIK